MKRIGRAAANIVLVLTLSVWAIPVMLVHLVFMGGSTQGREAKAILTGKKFFWD